MDDNETRTRAIHARVAASQLNQYGEQYLSEFAKLVDARLSPDAETVVEYGTGMSTLVLGEALAQRQTGRNRTPVLLSIDHVGEWQRRVAAALPHWTFLHLRTWDLFGGVENGMEFGFNYATAPYLLRRQVDLAYVDGRTRAQCVLAIAPILKPGGSIILDDRERERYQFLDGYFDEIETHGRFKVFASPKITGEARARPLHDRQSLGIVRVVQGGQAAAEAAASRQSAERYAAAIGARLVDHFVADGEVPPEILKFTLGGELERFDRAIFIDCDLVIRAGAPSLFELVPETHLGVVREDRWLDRSAWLDAMVRLYDVAREHGANTAPYFNSGVMVMSRRHYLLFSLPASGVLYGHPLFEQTYLNARVRSLGCPLYELPKEFNYISDYDAGSPADWRYGWFLHLAGSWEEPYRTNSHWRETGKMGNFSVRTRQPITARDTRPPRLRALARAIDRGERILMFGAPQFLVPDERRVFYDPEASCVVIDLTASSQRPLMWGPYAALAPGRWAVAIQLRGAGASGASLAIDCVSERGTEIIRGVQQITADDCGVIRFEIAIDRSAASLEVRCWEGSPRPASLEAMELRLIDDLTP